MKMDRLPQPRNYAEVSVGTALGNEDLACRVPLPGAVFLFSANTQYENAGDALINRELLGMLRPWGAIRVARAGAPAAFLAQLRLQPGELRYTSRAALWLGALALGMTAWLPNRRRPYLVLTPGDPGGRLDRDVLFRGVWMLALSLVGIRIVRLGVSLGRMSPGRLRFEAFLSRFYAHIGIRDSHSLALAKRSGFRNAAYFPDLALALAPLEARPKRNGSLSVAISLRDDNIGMVERQMLVDKLDQLIRSLSSEHELTLHCVAQVTMDTPFMRFLEARYADRATVFMTEEGNLDRLVEIYRGMDLIVGNRLHALLLAAAQGAIPLGLLFPQQNGKIIELLKDIGLSSYWQNPMDPNVPAIGNFTSRQATVRAAFKSSRRMIEERARALFGS